MARRWFTADFHLGSGILLNKDLMGEHVRPFKSIEKMNSALLRSCNQRAKEDDVIIHLGDFCNVKSDRGNECSKLKSRDYLKQINATLVNIRGNHDDNNGTLSIGDSMRTRLGKRFVSVSCSHYPSYDPRAKGTFRSGDVHIHGHKHFGDIFTIDKKNLVLNVNVSCGLWKYQIISEDELITKIEQFLKSKNFQLPMQKNRK